MKRMSRNLTTIYRTERLIAQRRLAVVQRQVVLMAVAGIAALTALILLNVSLYLLLASYVTPAASAGILAAANIVLAAVFATLAGRMNAEDDIAPAVEVRDMALADLEEEVEEMAEEGRKVVDSVRKIGTDPFGSLSSLLVPILTALLKKKT